MRDGTEVMHALEVKFVYDIWNNLHETVPVSKQAKIGTGTDETPCNLLWIIKKKRQNLDGKKSFKTKSKIFTVSFENNKNEIHDQARRKESRVEKSQVGPGSRPCILCYEFRAWLPPLRGLRKTITGEQLATGMGLRIKVGCCCCCSLSTEWRAEWWWWWWWWWWCNDDEGTCSM